MKKILILFFISHIPFMIYAQSVNDSLFYAIKSNNNKLLLVLIHKGADVNHIQQTGPWLKVSPLISAVQKKNVEMVKILIDSKADINWKDSFQTTALLYAAASGQKDLVAILLEHHADPDVKDQNGNTLTSAAKESGNEELIMYLTTRLKK